MTRGIVTDERSIRFARAQVVVDFTASWCGPCKQLGPILEKVVSEAEGAVRLVKIDIDQNQQLAQQLRIQSIPAVIAFYQGRPLDAVQGALPESQLKEFVKDFLRQSINKSLSFFFLDD